MIMFMCVCARESLATTSITYTSNIHILIPTYALETVCPTQYTTSINDCGAPH